MSESNVPEWQRQRKEQVARDRERRENPEIGHAVDPAELEYRNARGKPPSPPDKDCKVCHGEGLMDLGSGIRVYCECRYNWRQA